MTPAPTHAPGLHGDWLNGWLAALGITVLVDDTRLAWSDDPVPHAVVTSPGPEPLVARIAAALPATAELAALAVARNLPGVAELSRKVTREAYASRVPTARSPGDFTLAATVTDLADDGADGFLRHAPLDPPVPKGLTLWERLVDCRKAVENPAAMTAATLAGRGQRRKLNGLGFDYLRLRHAAHPIDENWVDPVVELLTFMGLAFLPIRSNKHLATARG